MFINDNVFARLKNFSDKSLKKEIYSSRYVKSFKCCPHCGSVHFIKFGKYSESDIQRYRCKDCGRTFSNTTNSVWKYCKKPCEKWIEFVQYLMNGATLKYCAEKLNISIATAFYWRHKFLHCIDKNTPKNFKNIVLLDENCRGISNKGNKGMAYQYKNKFYKMYDLFRTGVIMGIIYDTNDSMAIKVIGKERPWKKDEEMMFEKIDEKAYVKSVNGRKFKNSIIKHNKKVPLKVRKSLEYDPHSYYIKDNIDCPKEVLTCSQNLRTWLGRFNGVASKYLNHYCSLFSLGFVKKEYNYMNLFFEVLCNNMMKKYYLKISELKSVHDLEFEVTTN